MDKARENLLKLKNALLIERDEDYNQYIEHFKKNNINYRKKNGLTWYPIVITNEEIGAGDYITIEVERTTNHNEPHMFSGGKNVELFVNVDDAPRTLNGTIKNIQGNKARISLNVDELPEWTEQGRLGMNLLFDDASYKEMDIALTKVIGAEENRLAELREIFYGLKDASFDNSIPEVSIAGLNASQNDAVNRILKAKDVAAIHGPPGTGKTTTLVEAIKETLKTEKQILVCSTSNVSVDVLIEKLSAHGVPVLRLGNPARVSEEVLNSTLDVKVAGHPSFHEIKQLKKTAEEYFRMASKYKRTFGRSDREQRNLLYAEAKKIVKEAAALEDYITADVFEKAQVIACTPVVSSGRMMREKRFTTVFIDEAAQAMEPMCWIPITRSNRVIFAGDHLQLPPTVKTKDTDAQLLKNTLFERITKYKNITVMLDTQYRMHHHIMGFSNRQFYEDKLVAHQSVRDALLTRTLEKLYANKAVEFIDTAGCGFEEILNPESLSIYNPEEANLLFKHLHLLYNEMLEDKHITNIKIGIISPYKEQVEHIKQQLEMAEDLQHIKNNIVVKTIDGFQGQEKDVIYISLARSNNAADIGFLSDTRRMNVALTRAKKKLVVIGDSATLGNHKFYQEFLNYIEEIGAYTSAWEFA